MPNLPLMAAAERLRIRRRGPTNGTVRLPGSKSLTNRALVCAALAGGTSTLVGALDADDTRVMKDCLYELGAAFSETSEGIVVEGTNGRLKAPARPLDAAASGTTARFLTAAATLADGPSIIDGTARMRERPIGELVAALQTLGAEVETLGEAAYPPVRVGGGGLPGGHTVIDARRSSQFVSAVALAAPYAARSTSLEFLDGILVSRPYVENTVEVMQAFGVDAELDRHGLRVPRGEYRSCTYRVDPDASAAAYPLVAAAITGGLVRLAGFSPDSAQADLGILDVLAAMGCVVEWSDSEVALNGPPKGLKGVEADMADMPDATLAVAVAATFASGPTRLTSIGSLRVKETDRLDALKAELSKLGAQAETGPDWLIVRPRPLHGAEIETYEDHRMAMAFALVGLIVPGVVIRDPGCVAKTWPTFYEDLEQLWPDTPGSWWLAGNAAESVVVAIDGPGGAGKTTVSRGVADRLGLPHLDTGAFYRAAALAASRSGVDIDDTGAVTDAVQKAQFDYRAGTMLLEGEDVNDAIRSPGASSQASRVSAIPRVRKVLVARQRAWVEEHGGSAVVEGRDIGTVVFPEARVKVFLTARPDVRAHRRAGEQPGSEDTLEGVARELEQRDRRDSTREASPLLPAEDAVEVDTSDLSIDEVIAQVVRLVEDRVGA